MTTSINEFDSVWAPPNRAVDEAGNEYTRINDAIDNADSLVLIGPGTFDEEVVVDKDDLTVRGVGNATKIMSDIDNPLTIGGEDCQIVDMALEIEAGNGNASSPLITQAGAASCKITNVNVVDCNQDAFFLNHGEGHEIRNCEIESAGDQGIVVSTRGVVVEGCIIKGAVSNDGIVVVERNCKVEGNRIIDVGDHGILSTDTDTQIDNNIINSVTDNGIRCITASSVGISNNRILSSGGDGIYVSGVGNKVTGNIVTGSTGINLNTSGVTSGVIANNIEN